MSHARKWERDHMIEIDDGIDPFYAHKDSALFQAIPAGPTQLLVDKMGGRLHVGYNSGDKDGRAEALKRETLAKIAQELDCVPQKTTNFIPTDLTIMLPRKQIEPTRIAEWSHINRQVQDVFHLPEIQNVDKKLYDPLDKYVNAMNATKDGNKFMSLFEEAMTGNRPASNS